VLPLRRIEAHLEHVGVGRRRIVIKMVTEDANSGGGNGHPAGIDRAGR
jgi:hypothetical protein